MAEEKKNNRGIELENGACEIRIADEVVAVIAGLAATEVDGVVSLAGNATGDLISRLGMKGLQRGIRLEVAEDHVSVDAAIVIKYGCSIPDVSKKVQERICSAIENMTGLRVSEVSIRIAGVKAAD